MEDGIKLYINSILLFRNIGHTTLNVPATDNKYFLIHPESIYEHYVFLYVDKGDFDIFEGGIKYRISDGQGIFLKKGIPVKAYMKQKQGSSWYWIHFYDSASDSNDSTPLHMGKLYNTLFFPDNYRHYIILPKVISNKHVKNIDVKLKSLLALLRSQSSLRHYQLSLELMELFIYIFQQYDSENKHSKRNIICVKITEYLENRIDGDILAYELEKILGVTYYYAGKVFKNQVGISITEYHTKMKINKAVQLLADTALNISQVSDILGFKSPYYFSRVFKKVMGKAPSEYIGQVYGRMMGGVQKL